MTEASSQCGERQLLGDSFLGGDPLQQKEYVDRLHALVDSLRQKLEESQDMLQRMRQDSLAVAKERDDVVRRCDQLLARRLQEEQGKVADIGVLQREVKEKNAKLVLLHSRFQQAEGQLLSLQEANAGVLAEMRQLNQQLGEERRKNLELERQLQLAQFSEDRQRDYATLLEDLRVEKRAVEEENARLVQQLLHQQGSIEGDLRREYEDQLKGMEASIFKWETVSKRQFQDLTLLQGKFDTVQEEYKAVREAKARLEQQLARLQGEHQALAEKLQLCAALQGEARPADLETALAVVRAARLKGQPTDLEFLLPAFDQQTGGKLELEHMRAENATLLRDLATSHKFVGVLKQRLEEVERREKERIQQLQETMEQLQAQGRQAKESDGRIIQSQLEKILHLEANVLGVKQQLGTRLSIDGGLGPLNRLAPDENLIEVYLGHLRLEAAYFEADPAACPPPIFVALDFLDHVTQTTAVVADLSPVFDNTYMYSVQMNEFLLFYLQNKTLDLDLNRSHGADYSTLATASIPLFDLLEPPFALRGFALLLSPQRERVGLLEYGVVVKRPLPQHWLVECREAQRRGVGKVALKLEEKEADAMYHRLDGAVSLSIHVIACADLTPLAGLSSDGGPACVPYVNYTFFTHPDMHVEMATPGVRTVAPDFHHVHSYPCVFSVPFLSYLAFGSLPVVVFNELDDNVENYVGSVLVPLKGLLDGPDAKVTGTFDLADPAGKPAGRLTLSLWWNPREVRSLDEELSLAELGEFD